MIKHLFAAAFLLAGAYATTARAAEPKDFPSQTHWILSIDVKAAHASPLLNSLVGQFDPAKRKEAQTKLDAVKALFGIDLLKDLDHVVVAGNGDAQKGGVAYVYGTFDAPRLTAILAASKGYQTSDRNGVNVMTWIDDKDNKTKHLAFAKPNLAMLSNSRETLVDALDVLAGKKAGLEATSPLGAAIKRSENTLLTLQAYGVSSIVGADPKAEALKQAEALSLSIRSPNAETLGAELSVSASSDETALQIQQALMGIQAIAMLRASEAPESATLASQAKISCDSRNVAVSLNLTKAMIESAIKAHEAKRAAKQAPAAATQTSAAGQKM